MDGWMVGWLCLTSHRPPFTIPCKARFIHLSNWESNHGPLHGSPLHNRCATPAPQLHYDPHGWMDIYMTTSIIGVLIDGQDTDNQLPGFGGGNSPDVYPHSRSKENRHSEDNHQE